MATGKWEISLHRNGNNGYRKIGTMGTGWEYDKIHLPGTGKCVQWVQENENIGYSKTGAVAMGTWKWVQGKWGNGYR